MSREVSHLFIRAHLVPSVPVRFESCDDYFVKSNSFRIRPVELTSMPSSVQWSIPELIFFESPMVAQTRLDKVWVYVMQDSASGRLMNLQRVLRLSLLTREPSGLNRLTLRLFVQASEGGLAPRAAKYGIG